MSNQSVFCIWNFMPINFGDLAAIAVAIAKTSWSTCNGASYQELWLHSILF